ncbi:MAG: hypothetical protein K2H01_03145 [Ruminococcus sp.]|nr:hypothetical protein [Ruminococcus sp.]
MNHEKKTDTYGSLTIANVLSAGSANSKYSEMQSCYYSLRDRIFNMLASGTSTVRIIREVKNDKFCTGSQKRCILKELHLI